MNTGPRFVVIAYAFLGASSVAVVGCRSEMDGGAFGSPDATAPDEPRVPATPTLGFESVDAEAACAWLQPDAPLAPRTDAGVTRAQAACNGNDSNPPECPATSPAVGSPCAVPGLACLYRAPNGGWPFVITCGSHSQGAWGLVSGLVCSNPSCGAPTGDGGLSDGDAGPALAACGSLPDIPCLDIPQGFPGGTNWERAGVVLASVGSCCGRSKYDSVAVTLTDGCPTSIRVSGPGPQTRLAACMERYLAGRRIQCAGALTCAGFSGWGDP